MRPSVALLVVSHDGASWLPTVISGIGAQTVAPDQVVAIDTGSKDGSSELLEQAFGAALRVPGTTTYPEAVALGLERVAESAPEWVWLLHDDSTPAPDALEQLLAAAEQHPEASILGPKLREWPSLRRLLELGVTISGTGRRETGLERGEYDQGQHDAVRTVLAVNTAGMLVRRSVLLELGGFDPQLPIFGNDIDLGWRAASAGHRTVIVPQAVVFHAEAAHRGIRQTPLTGKHTHYEERRAALYTLLANSRPWALPLQMVRLFFGTLLRMLGFLVVREVGSALDELAALLSVYRRPGTVHAARRARRERATAAPAEVRQLLAPPWLPYRHGLDFIGDVVSALTTQASDVAERRRVAAAEADPASFAARELAAREAVRAAEEDEVPVENGWLVRFFTNPVSLVLTVVVVLGLIGSRTAWHAVAGGGLSPAPSGVGVWWDLQYQSWHPLGLGTAVPAPPYLLPLALLGTLLGGSASLTISVVLIVSFPLALWGAWRLLRVVGRLISHRGAPRWLILWGATTYALLPIVSGAWGDGRLGAVVATALLPWLAHAALGFAEPEVDRRWRAAWRTGLLLTLITCFTPSAWLVALVLGVLVAIAAVRIAPGAIRRRTVWSPPAAALGTAPVLLLPWWLPALIHGAGAGLLLDAGRLPSPQLTGSRLLIGRLSELGAPWWVGLIVPVLAVLALIPARTRIPVLLCWIAMLATAIVAMVLGLLTLHLAHGTTPAGLLFALVCLKGGAIIAAVLGAQGALADGLHAWRRGVAGAVAVVATIAPLTGLAWFVGHANESLSSTWHDGVPLYMVENAQRAPEHGVLVIRGSTSAGLRYYVMRGDGTTIGDDEIMTLTPEDTAFTALVQQFVSQPTDDVVQHLADAGVQYVVLPPRVDAGVAAAIDASGAVTQASAANRATRAWQLDAEPHGDMSGHRSWLRIALLLVQAGGIVLVVVLCLPTLERRRRR
ncbi:glycosyltransferase family 2 protein [Nocardioides nematodiphilus]|uniref:glycosyltransferase family 2 protein n=1 Tax=Nocardioides nematodiphilus TaxID=2849669 RepID=UPI001CD975D0|nr:glycosyltransferase family 2 protein [Nocardioides nematodiphilus]MCA1984050.1 glycosyltransferase family 2 protein [Nocardioides nematodiphilus]